MTMTHSKTSCPDTHANFESSFSCRNSKTENFASGQAHFASRVLFKAKSSAAEEDLTRKTRTNHKKRKSKNNQRQAQHSILALPLERGRRGRGRGRGRGRVRQGDLLRKLGGVSLPRMPPFLIRPKPIRRRPRAPPSPVCSRGDNPLPPPPRRRAATSSVHPSPSAAQGEGGAVGQGGRRGRRGRGAGGAGPTAWRERKASWSSLRTITVMMIVVIPVMADDRTGDDKDDNNSGEDDG